MSEPAVPADAAAHLEGLAVLDAGGWKTGVIRRVQTDGAGRPELAVVHTGGLLGHDVLVPLQHAAVKEDGVHLGVERDRITSAPAVHGAPTEDQRDEAYAHFGMHSLASDDDPDREGRLRDDQDDRPHGDTELIRIVRPATEGTDDASS